MWRYAYNLRGIYETPSMPQHADAALQRGEGRAHHRAMCAQSGRTILTEFESKQLLTAYGIPTVETRVAATEEEAVESAQEIGFPVVLKLYSRDHHAQDRRRRRAAESSRCATRCERAFAGHSSNR